MKKFVTVAIVLVMAILIGAILYWQYTQTPKYSLLQAKKAVEQHDLASFEKYVDVEGITSSLIDQILELSTEGKEQQGEWEQLGEAIGKGLIMLLKPQLTKTLKQQIAKYVETGKFEEEKKSRESEEPEISLSDLWNKSGGEKNVFKGIAYVKKEGKIAYVGLEFFQEKYDTSLILNLKMRDKDGYWQVAEISNFSEFMRKLDDLETRRIAELNKPIIEAMKQSLVLESLQKSTTSDRWGFDKKAVFRLKFKNNGQKEIDEYKGVLKCKTLDGKVLKRLSITDSDNISSGQTGAGVWSTDVNMFIANDNTLYETPQSNLDISVEIQYIKFTDGSELKLYEKGQDT
jgi:hypothetical protein